MARLNLNQEVADHRAEVAARSRDEAVMGRVVRAAAQGRDMDRERAWRARAERLYHERRRGNGKNE